MFSEPLACSSTHPNEGIETPKTQELLFDNGTVFLEECTVEMPSSVVKTVSVRSLNISAAANGPLAKRNRKWCEVMGIF